MKRDTGLLTGSTPLLVLSLLQSGDKYGYQMVQDLSLRSEKVFELKEGTLYPILHALEKSGALTAYEQEAPTGRKRKYYHLTDKGRKQLVEQQAQWRAFSTAVEKVLQFG